jgi:hypothetical protein
MQRSGFCHQKRDCCDSPVVWLSSNDWGGRIVSGAGGRDEFRIAEHSGGRVGGSGVYDRGG